MGGEKFDAKGLMISERNYLDIYTFDKWSTKRVPYLERGQKIYTYIIVIDRRINKTTRITHRS